MMITQLGSIFGDFQVASIISGKELSQQILSELQSEVEHIAEHIARINRNNTQSLLDLVKTGNDISLSQGLELEKNVNLKNSKHF